MKTKHVFFTVMLLVGSVQLLTGQMTENTKTINPFVFEGYSERNPLAIPEIGDSRMGFFKRMCNKTKFSMYQDIVIEYDMLTGKQNLYLRKVGSSDKADEVKYANIRTIMKIKKNRTIYLRLNNYNSNLYRLINGSKSDEFVLENVSRKSFIASINSLNPEQEASTQQESFITLEEENIPVKFKSVLAAGINSAIKNDVKKNLDIKKMLEVIKEGDKGLPSNANVSENVNSESIIIGLNSKIEELDKKLGTYSKTMNSLSLKFNQNLERLEIDSKVLYENLQEVALRKDPKKQRDDVALYLNEYIGKIGDSKPMPTLYEFKQKPLELKKEMENNLKKFTLNLDTIKMLYESVSRNVVGINTILILIKDQADSTKNQIQQLAERYKVLLNNEKEYINNFDVKLIQMKQVEARVNSKDWNLYFTEIYKTGESIQNAENEIELKIHQANKDVARIEIQFERLEQKNGTLGYAKIDDAQYKIEHDFMVFRGAKLSFSTGIAFSFPIAKNSYSYTKKYNGPDSLKGGIQADSIIVRDAENAFSPVWMNMIHAQWRSSRDLAVALSMGIGITLNDSKQVQYLLGTSLIFGSSERFVLTGGFSAFRTNKLGGGYSVNELIPNNQPIPIVKDQYTFGMFLATSFNFGISN